MFHLTPVLNKTVRGLSAMKTNKQIIQCQRSNFNKKQINNM